MTCSCVAHRTALDATRLPMLLCSVTHKDTGDLQISAWEREIQIPIGALKIISLLFAEGKKCICCLFANRMINQGHWPIFTAAISNEASHERQ